MSEDFILKAHKSFQRSVDTITEKEMSAILSKFTVLCLFSYFVTYFLKLKLILLYNRVVCCYSRIYVILLPHTVYHESFSGQRIYVSADMSFDFFQVPHAELRNPHRISTFTLYLCGSNKGFSWRFCVGSRVRHKTPEEGRKTYRLKHCDYNNKNEVSSLNILSNNI